MKLPGKPILPITPTADEHGNPTICRCCPRRAIGAGVGLTSRHDSDPGFLCSECLMLIETIKTVRRFDVYELHALDAAVEAVSEYRKQFGFQFPHATRDQNALTAGMDAGGGWLAERGVSDLSTLSEEQVLDFVKAIFSGCLAGLAEVDNFDELDGRMMVKAAITGFGDGLRKLLREEAPF